MARWGYTMMTEQSPPDQLVRDVRAAEEAGFDFSVSSDHYQLWLESQGHAGYAWSILGAAAQATDQIPLMTYVTCPILRYIPWSWRRRRRPCRYSPVAGSVSGSAPARA
jgi:alkanesulfonate monooxygenase SsuD/methylene tetrahydromethanopterin reductase-like flavin-dependent oxidoreductase (luciferase family)